MRVRTINGFIATWAYEGLGNIGGGPGHVARGIAKELRQRGINTTAVMPGHVTLPSEGKKTYHHHLPPVDLKGELFPLSIDLFVQEKVPVYTIGNDRIFQGPHLYQENASLANLVFFSQGFIKLMAKMQPNFVIALDWPTALIAHYLQAYGGRIFPDNSNPFSLPTGHRDPAKAAAEGSNQDDAQKESPLPLTWKYFQLMFDPYYRGEIPRREFHQAGLQLENFDLAGIKRNGTISLVDLALKMQEFTAPDFYQVIDAKDLVEPGPAQIWNLADQLISSLRRTIPFSFKGMELDRLTAHPSGWQVLTPLEILRYNYPPIADMVEGSRSLTEKDRETVLAAAENGQAHVLANIVPEEMYPMIEDLRKIDDWQDFHAFQRRVINYDPFQENEAVTFLHPGRELPVIEDVPAPDLVKQGEEIIAQGRLMVLSNASSSGIFFYGRPAEQMISVGLQKIKIGDQRTTFFAEKAKDLAKAQARFGITIPWAIMTPIGEKGEKIKEYFYRELVPAMGLSPEQLFFFEHLGRYPVIDKKGMLFLQAEGKRLVLTAQGHGQILSRFKASGQMATVMEKFGSSTVFFTGGLRNLGASVSTDQFLALLASHQAKGMTAELVGNPTKARNGLSLPVRGENGRTKLAPYHSISRPKRREARDQEIPVFTNSFLADLKLLALHDSKVLLPAPRIRPVLVEGEDVFERIRVTEDLTTLLPTQLIVMPGARYVHPAQHFWNDFTFPTETAPASKP